MNCVAIVQARMGSSRLPGKVLMPLAKQPALWHVIERLRHAKQIDSVLVATTESAKDDAIEAFCNGYQVDCFRGSELDVLDRYYQAAKSVAARTIVRITADCPVLDPQLVDKVVCGFRAGGYALYGLDGEFPDGLDCVAFSFTALEIAWREAKLPSEREHVCPYIINHPERFRTGGYKPFSGLAQHRWTLDEPEDYRFLQEIYQRLYKPGKPFGYEQILSLLEREPELMRINSGIVRNAGYLKSLQEDARVVASGNKA